MMFKIALRNIFRRKRRSIITILTMLVGFMLAAVSIAWSDGTYNNIINLFSFGKESPCIINFKVNSRVKIDPTGINLFGDVN